MTCAAQHVAPGGLRCTASVINLNSKAAPQGQLSFSGDGSFSPQSCTARTCSTLFTAPTTPGPYQIIASFDGDGPFDGSSDSIEVPN